MAACCATTPTPRRRDITEHQDIMLRRGITGHRDIMEHRGMADITILTAGDRLFFELFRIRGLALRAPGCGFFYRDDDITA